MHKYAPSHGWPRGRTRSSVDQLGLRYVMGVVDHGRRCRASGGVVAGLLILLCSGCVAGTAATVAGAVAEYDARYRDPEQPLNRRVGDLVRRMTLTEKVGQMAQVEQRNATAAVVNAYLIGSVVTGAGSAPAARAAAVAWMEMVNEAQRGALSTRLGIPVLYGIDAATASATSTAPPSSRTTSASAAPGVDGFWC